MITYHFQFVSYNFSIYFFGLQKLSPKRESFLKLAPINGAFWYSVVQGRKRDYLAYTLCKKIHAYFAKTYLLVTLEVTGP